MASILGKLFKRKPKSPISITTKKEKAAGPIKISVPKQKAPAVKIDMPKTESRPAIGIKLPHEKHEHLTIDLPAQHIPDAEALSQIVSTTAGPQKSPKAAAPEPAATIDQVVASLPKKGAVTKSSVIKTAPPKKAGRRTKHDKMIASIASRSTQARPARKR